MTNIPMEILDGLLKLLAALGIIVVGVLIGIAIADDFTLVGILDDGSIIPLGAAAAYLWAFLFRPCPCSAPPT